MDIDKVGSAAGNVMTLIVQLEDKVRAKNAIIEELKRENDSLHELLEKVAQSLGLKAYSWQLEDIKKKIKGLKEDGMMWRTKFILSTMLNWANPYPLIIGLVAGAGVGAWIEYLRIVHVIGGIR